MPLLGVRQRPKPVETPVAADEPQVEATTQPDPEEAPVAQPAASASIITLPSGKKAFDLSNPETREKARASQAKISAENRAKAMEMAERAARIFEPTGFWRESRKGMGGWLGRIGDIARTSWVWHQRVYRQDHGPATTVGNIKANIWTLIYRADPETIPSHPKLIAFVNAFLDDIEARGWETVFKENMPASKSTNPPRPGYDIDRDEDMLWQPPVEEPAVDPVDQVADETITGPQPIEDSTMQTGFAAMDETVDETTERVVAASFATAPANGEPPVALEALALMAQRAESQTELDRAIGVAHRILRLQGNGQ